MVLLAATQAAKAAVEELKSLSAIQQSSKGCSLNEILGRLAALQIGEPVDHEDLIQISAHLVKTIRENGHDSHKWRLEFLLRGASVYQPPPPAKSEPVGYLSRLRYALEVLTYD